MSNSILKIVILGDGGVGKSALTIQLTQNHFVAEYDPTIENSYRKQIQVDTKPYMLDVLDTAGQEELSVMRDQYMRQGRGFLLIYSVQSATSFGEAMKIYQQILRVKDMEAVPAVLCGNKCDLPDSMREVTQEEGKSFADQHNLPFFETSAKERINVEECFEECVREVLKFEGNDEAENVEKKKHVRKKIPKGCTLL
eukprot:TRINITY_DN1416_c0_g1_i1.p1 TRINITY_DN1416_c0_g1~~TRINITY_DN1416_c0_g1_i1.p1  ORF type:complete len:197 (-),score=33.79 TRINITY_DN1416_c0_g1_i1:52-642(-)